MDGAIRACEYAYQFPHARQTTVFIAPQLVFSGVIDPTPDLPEQEIRLEGGMVVVGSGVALSSSGQIILRQSA